MKLLPSTFEHNPGQARCLITEEETMGAKSAVKGIGHDRQFALAHRSGLGCIVFIHTTDMDLVPAQYTLITQPQVVA
jgi:hypothetical protein